MPVIKLTEILSYSNEDENNAASNLLISSGSKKWICKLGTNEKQHHVIIKLEKLSSITSIDIGNEHSAFIEILAGREGVDFQVLLVASSFMTPLESRNSTNVNRVRMFDYEKLNKAVADQKWDRIKVICTQPFNKNVPYGLSFIVINGNPTDSKESDKTSDSNKNKLGKFILQELSDVSSPGTSLFSVVKENNLSMAASIRAASNSLKNNESTSLKRKSAALSDEPIGFYQMKKTKMDVAKSDKDIGSSPSEKSGSMKIKPDKTQIKEISTNDTAKDKTSVNVKNAITNIGSSKSVKYVPFKKLMDGVVFCLSGFQNPQRSNHREKLLEMGAKCKRDWDKSCTHLICAFANTPKFQAVKGKGKIVKETWIEDCYNEKKKLHWWKYSLEKNVKSDTNEEIWASELLVNDENGSSSKKSLSTENDSAVEDSDDTDTEIQEALKPRKDSTISNNASTTSTVSGLKPTSDDEYDVDTDVDDEQEVISNKSLLPDLPSYFEGKSFFLYRFTNKEKQKTLERYIIAYKGKISPYMSKSTTFVITDGPWDDNFDEALNDNASLQFIKPQWIWKCCDKQKLVPFQPFLVTCSDDP